MPSSRPLLTRPALWNANTCGAQDEGVDDLVELGQRVFAVEIGEAVECGHRLGLIRGLVEPVELLEHRRAPGQVGVDGEDRLEPFVFGFIEAVGALERQEPVAEHGRVERRGHVPGWLAALDAAAHLDQARCEPPGDLEASSTWVACPRCASLAAL